MAPLRSLILIAPLLALACQGGGEAGPADGGAGGLGGTNGGGSGGGFETGGTGPGGTGEIACGAGTSWIDSESAWAETPIGEVDELPSNVRRARPECLRFPRISWQACGQGCEYAEFDSAYGEPAYPALSTSFSGGDARVTLALSLETPTRTVRRLVDVQSGQTLAALRLDAKAAGSPLQGDIGYVASSALVAPVAMGASVIYAQYEWQNERWDFKLPPVAFGSRELNCTRFGLDSSPPAMLFGCDAIETMSRAGSSEVETIPDSRAFGAGAGNVDLLAWTEVETGAGISRVKLWDASRGTRELVPSWAGAACAIAISPDRVVGLVGSRTRTDLANDCGGALVEPRVWYAPIVDGERVEGPLLDQEPVFVLRVATWRNLVAAVVAKEPRSDLPPWEQFAVVLVDTSDWSVRRYEPREGFSFHLPLVALDDRFLYVGESRTAAADVQEIDRLYRYALPANESARFRDR